MDHQSGTTKIINDTFSAKQRRNYQSGTSKLQQKFNNTQHIQEKNEMDHNFNIEIFGCRIHRHR